MVGSSGRAVGVGAAVVLLAALGGSELLTWRASRDLIPPAERHPGPARAGEVVLVLGYPARPDGRPSAVQRWRTRIAVRSTDPTVGRLLFSGGPTTGGRSEAAAMAQYAVEVLHIPASRIELEEEARTTWENVALTLPRLRSATRIIIASNTFHARRARQYLLVQAPELGARLHRARDHRPVVLAPVDLALLAVEVRRALRARRLR